MGIFAYTWSFSWLATFAIHLFIFFPKAQFTSFIFKCKRRQFCCCSCFSKGLLGACVMFLQLLKFPFKIRVRLAASSLFSSSSLADRVYTDTTSRFLILIILYRFLSVIVWFFTYLLGFKVGKVHSHVFYTLTSKSTGQLINCRGLWTSLCSTAFYTMP